MMKRFLNFVLRFFVVKTWTKVFFRALDIGKWVALAFILLMIIAYLTLISPFGQHQIGRIVANAASNAGNGTCTIRYVHLWGFPVVQFDGIVWTTGADTVISCDTVSLSVLVLPLIRGHINAPFVKLNGLRVNIRQDSAQWNIANLFTRTKPITPITIPPKPKGKSFISRIAVGQLSIPNARVNLHTKTESINLTNDTITIRAENFLYLPERISLQQFKLLLPQLAVTLDQAKVNLTKSPPYGSVNGTITIPDSTIQRFLKTWPKTDPVAVDFVASNSPNGLNTHLGFYLPGESAVIQLQNIDAKLHTISVEATFENINLSSFVAAIDSSDLTADVKGTVTNILSDPSIKGELLVKNSTLKPLKNIGANIAFGYDKRNASVKGKIDEFHGNITLDVSTKGLAQEKSSAKLTASGRLRHLREFLPGTDYPDSMLFNADVTSSGKTFPIDTIRFTTSTSKQTWFQNAIDTLFVRGVYTAKRLNIDSAHTASGTAKVDGSGTLHLDDGFEFHGSIRNLILEKIPQLVAVDSTIAGKANLNFAVHGGNRSVKDTSAAAFDGSVTGDLLGIEFSSGSVDSIHISHAEFHYPDSPYLLEAQLDSVRTKFLAPVSLSVSGEWHNDSIRASLTAKADTISAQLAFHGQFNPKSISGTAIPDTMILKTSTMPIYLLNSPPIAYANGKVQWDGYQLDTPFGVLHGSITADTSGNLTGSNSIDHMQFTSLAAIVPSLRSLQGEVAAKGDWSKKSGAPLRATGTVSAIALGWNNLDLYDTLTTDVTYTGTHLLWNMKGRREGLDALTSYGDARLTDSSIAGFDSLYVSTIEMPSRWFRGMMPTRSVWDGSVQLHIDRDEKFGMKMSVDVTGKKLILPDYGIEEHDIVIHAATVGNALVIQEARTKSGKGEMKLTGRMTFRDFLPDSLNLLAVGNAFRFMKMPLKTFTGDMNIRVNGTVNHLRMNGSTTLSEVRYDIGEQDKNLEDIVLEDDEVSPFPAMTIWDNSSGKIDISAPGNVWVRGLGINAEAKMSLEMSKRSGIRVPEIYGTVEVIRGTVVEYGRQLKISEGIMRFTGDAFDPDLSITASAEDLKAKPTEVDIKVVISGTAQKPVIQLSGYDISRSPPMQLNEIDVISYLALGTPSPVGSSSTSGQTLGATTIASGATGAGISSLSNFVGSRLGLSMFQYKMKQSNQAARDTVQVGGYITDKLFFSVASPVDVTTVKGKDFRVEYQLLPWLRLAAGNEALTNQQSLEAYIQTEWGAPVVKRDTTRARRRR